MGSESVQRLDKDLPSGWRDGEVLCLLGEAYKDLGEFAAAIPILQEAIGGAKANARIETVEQLANCLDRRAKQLSKAEPAVAQKMWGEAQRFLENLNTTLGESSERLSLLGALWKRRGEAQSEPTSEEAKRNFEQSADFYRRAYLYTRRWHNEVDVYSGLNWMTVSYLSRTPADPERDTAMKECLEQSPKLKETPDFWDRVHEPDALLLSYLFANTLDQHVDEVADKYKRVFQFAGPVETDSVTGQWKFMQQTAPNASLSRLIHLLDHEKDGG
jgi:tetratricopeptide (TPR) repeat protein